MNVAPLGAPVMITWQLTRDCDLACLHCCTDSAPGRALPNELSREEALKLADQIVAAGVPYVMLCGGEPTLVPHFLEVAEKLGRGGVFLKIETNGQAFTEALAGRLAALPIRSLQISLDGDTQEIYQRQRPGGSLAKAWDACRFATEAGLPLEITFAPTQINRHQLEAVIDRAASLGAFRFNTGLLMRLGTAAKLWDRLVLPAADTDAFIASLERKEAQYAGRLELCFRPLSVESELQDRLREPAGALLVLPDGRVKVAAPLPYVCADLRGQTLSQAWTAYRRAWSHPDFVEAARRLGAEPSRMSSANHWTDLPEERVTPG